MKKSGVLALAVASMFTAHNAQAVEVAGDALNIYGKLHLSADVSDTDGLVAGSDASISSNSSRLGFKGKHDTKKGVAVVWQLESEIRPDSSNETDKKETIAIASRNSYVGLKGSFGTVVFGHHDTPYKTVGSKWGIFGDSVGERRAILGASATDNNKLNQRGKNAVLYMNKFGNVEFQAMYAADALDSSTGAVDNNDNDMTSVAIMYKEGPLSLAVAQESWSNLTVNSSDPASEIDGLRVSASYKFADAKVGAIYETTDGTAGVSDQWTRDVMGFNAAYKVDSTTYKLQYLQADDYEGQADSGATKTSVGVFNKLDKQTEVYLAYAVTDNDINAKFQAVDGGHGDEVKTVNGGSPSSLSAGLVYKF